MAHCIAINAIIITNVVFVLCELCTAAGVRFGSFANQSFWFFGRFLSDAKQGCTCRVSSPSRISWISLRRLTTRVYMGLGYFRLWKGFLLPTAVFVFVFVFLYWDLDLVVHQSNDQFVILWVQVPNILQVIHSDGRVPSTRFLFCEIVNGEVLC